jgi:hypothetical protein
MSSDTWNVAMSVNNNLLRNCLSASICSHVKVVKMPADAKCGMEIFSWMYITSADGIRHIYFQ